MSHIPEDRHKRGLILDFTVAENTVLQNYKESRFSKNGILKKNAIEQKLSLLKQNKTTLGCFFWPLMLKFNL